MPPLYVTFPAHAWRYIPVLEALPVDLEYAFLVSLSTIYANCVIAQDLSSFFTNHDVQLDRVILFSR